LNLSGSVAVAGMGYGLWAVQNGNRLVPQQLLNKSGANLHFDTKILKTSRINRKFYLFGAAKNDTENPRSFGPYDAVVLAAPLLGGEITFEHITLNGTFPKYHKLHVNFLTGQLKGHFSHLSAILTCCGYSNLNSIGLVQPVDGSEAGIQFVLILFILLIRSFQENFTFHRKSVTNLILVFCLLIKISYAILLLKLH